MTPRKLLALVALACLGGATATPAPADEGFSLLRWTSDPLEVAAFYHHPTKPFWQLAYPDIHEGSAAEGANFAFETGKSTKWFIEEQRGGTELVEAGVAQDDEALIDQGVRILDWGFARQNAQGGWDCPDTFHSATFFVEAGARAALCLQHANLPKYQAKVADWTTHLRAAGSWMNRPETLASDPWFYQLTHRSYLTAAALAETAALTGDHALTATAEGMIKNALLVQWPDGVNPEKNGYDVGYQVAGLNYALRYLALANPPPELRGPVTRMIARGMDFELTKLDASGTITTEGSTRMGHENSRSGVPKVVGYKPTMHALIGTSLLTGDQKYHDAATLIAHAQGFLPPGN